jgi:hypothetical protein
LHDLGYTSELILATRKTMTSKKEHHREVTCDGARTSHALYVALVLRLYLLLKRGRQPVHLLRLVGALKLPVAVLAAQVAVLIVLQRACKVPTHFQIL